VLRLAFAWLINRDLEVLNSRMIVATFTSLLGVLAISIDQEWFASLIGR
jgi:hypothetical protein